MGRGGKRDGAGRKPILDEEIIETIRRDCEQRAHQIRLQQGAQRHARKMANRGVFWGEDGEINPVRLPPRYRGFVEEYGFKNPQKKPPESLPEEVKRAIDLVRKNSKAWGVYSFSDPLPRLAEGRQKIIAQVAKDWGVSERSVRTIWESGSDV